MKGRPAESAAGAGAIALLIAYVVGVQDAQTIAVLGAVLGLVPAAVTLLVDGGGLIGVTKTVLTGRRPPGPPPPG